MNSSVFIYCFVFFIILKFKIFVDHGRYWVRNCYYRVNKLNPTAGYFKSNKDIDCAAPPKTIKHFISLVIWVSTCFSKNQCTHSLMYIEDSTVNLTECRIFEALGLPEVMRIGCVLSAFVWMLITWARLAWHYTVDFTQWLEAPPPQCTCCPIRCRGCQEVGWGRWFLFCCCERELKWKMTSKLSLSFSFWKSQLRKQSLHIDSGNLSAWHVTLCISFPLYRQKVSLCFLYILNFKVMYVLFKYYSVWIKCILFELYFIFANLV